MPGASQKPAGKSTGPGPQAPKGIQWSNQAWQHFTHDPHFTARAKTWPYRKQNRGRCQPRSQYIADSFQISLSLPPDTPGTENDPPEDKYYIL